MTSPLAAAAAARAKAAEAEVLATPVAESEPESQPEPAAKSKRKLRVVSDDVTEPVEAAANAEAQEQALQAAIDQYVAMIDEIEAARPIPSQTGATTDAPQLTGAEWVEAGVRQTLIPKVPGQYRIFTVITKGAVVVKIVCPPGADRLNAGKKAAEKLLDRGNLGEFTVELARDPNTVLLSRRDVAGPGPWRSHGSRAGAFQSGRDGQRTVFGNAGLVQKNKLTGNPQYPTVHSWGEDDRGGTCELRLPPGMILDQVRKAEPGLRQALNAPELTVTSRGVHPILHLNTKSIAADFPSVNPMPPTLFVRPRTPAERHRVATDFVLPLGVRADGSPILIKQAVTPHMGIFGGTGAGKTTLITSLVDAALAQGAEVILADGRAGKDLRQLALSKRNGIVSYCAGSQAKLHRAVQYVHDEYRRRQALQERLQLEGREYFPTPLLFVFDEWGSWIHTLSEGTKEQKAAAQVSVTRMEQLAAECRELRITLLLAGQHSYTSAMPGTLRANIKTLVVIGPPDDRHLAALFEGPKRQEARELGAQISPKAKGRGLVADATDEGNLKISMFQGFFNPPGPVADAMAKAVAATPKLRRFAWRFPLPGEEGGDGTWQDWTPASEPSSDTLPAQVLDLPGGSPDPTAAMFDPTSREYRPGVKPLSTVHATAN